MTPMPSLSKTLLDFCSRVFRTDLIKDQDSLMERGLPSAELTRSKILTPTPAMEFTSPPFPAHIDSQGGFPGTRQTRAHINLLSPVSPRNGKPAAKLEKRAFSSSVRWSPTGVLMNTDDLNPKTGLPSIIAGPNPDPVNHTVSLQKFHSFVTNTFCGWLPNDCRNQIFIFETDQKSKYGSIPPPLHLVVWGSPRMLTCLKTHVWNPRMKPSFSLTEKPRFVLSDDVFKRRPSFNLIWCKKVLQLKIKPHTKQT